jgi:hypothetical protein
VTAPVSNTNSYTWTADAKAGTGLIFALVDAQGRNGGTSNVSFVGNSGDSSCLSNGISSTPAATISVIPATNSASQSQSSTTATSKTKSGGLPTGAIIGIVVAVLAVVGGILLTYWWLKRRPNWDDLIWPDTRGGVDLDERGTYEPVTATTGQFTVTPYSDQVTSPPAQAGAFPSPGLGVGAGYAATQGSSSVRTSVAYSAAAGQPQMQAQYAVPGQQTSPTAFAYGQLPPATYGAPMPGVVPYIPPTQQQQQQPMQVQMQQAAQLAHAPSSASGQAGMSIARSSVMDASLSDAYTAYSGGGSDAGLMSSGQSGSGTGKSASGPTEEQRPSRFVMHTDITESDVIELPPQYSESRAPMPENLGGLE